MVRRVAKVALASLLVCAESRRETQNIQGALTTEFNLTRGCPDGLIKAENGGCSSADGSITFLDGGVINAPGLFAKLMADAIEDKTLVEPILADVSKLWKDDKESIKDRLLRLQHSEEEVEKALPVVKFFADMGIQPLIFEGVVGGLRKAASALSQTEGASNGVLSNILSSVAGGTEIFGNAVTSPLLAGLQGMLAYVQVSQEHLQAWEHTARIAQAMIQKAQCLDDRVSWRQDDVIQAGKVKNDFFTADIDKICPAESQKTLALEMLESNRAMQAFFKAVKEVGACLYPGADNKMYDPKIACMEAIVPALRQSQKQNGLLWSAIGMAVMHAHQADEILGAGARTYGSNVENIYNMDFEAYKTKKTLSSMILMSEASKEAQDLSCISLIASQRAYTKIFQQLKDAFNLWMRTYARSTMAPNAQTSWHPCRKVIHKLADEGAGVCKEEHKSAMDSASASICSNAYASRIWKDEQ